MKHWYKPCLLLKSPMFHLYMNKYTLCRIIQYFISTLRVMKPYVLIRPSFLDHKLFAIFVFFDAPQAKIIVYDMSSSRISLYRYYTLCSVQDSCMKIFNFIALNLVVNYIIFEVQTTMIGCSDKFELSPLSTLSIKNLHVKES